MNPTKRILSLALATCMALSMLLIPANAASFTDTKWHWAETLIEQAVAHGYVPAGGTFEPNKAITRNEFARMVNGAFGLTQEASISFTDVPASNTYYKDVRKAVAAGYIAGYEDNTFRGTNLITRQEAAVIIDRLVTYPGTLKEMTDLKDASAIAAWAQSAAKTVYTKGYMVGDNLKMFHPLGNLTRAETVKILETILSKETIVSDTVRIRSSNDRIAGTIYTGNLIVEQSLGQSAVQLTNAKVLGSMLVNGGGESGIRLSNTGIANMTIDSAYTTVGVAAVGVSTVNSLYVQTPVQLAEAGLYGTGAGFKNVFIIGNGAKVSMAGTFDKVSATASSTAELTSGKITRLDITAAGTGSQIHLNKNTHIDTAIIDGAAAFTGTGTISNAAVNADDVTFQTKPDAITTGIGSTAAMTCTTTPADGAVKVAADKPITLTFDDVLTAASGQSLGVSWVRSNVILFENTAAGASVIYDPSISPDGKTLTLTPQKALKENTDYLLTVTAGAFKGKTSGRLNAAVSVAFTTDGKAASENPSLTPLAVPPSGTRTLAPDDQFTFVFPSTVYDAYGDPVIRTDIAGAFTIRKNSQNGTKVDFEARISQDAKTITLIPSALLKADTDYYVILNDNELTNAAGEKIPGMVFTYYTGNTSAGELDVQVETGKNKADLTIDYDCSDTDADSLDITIYYREKGTRSWKTYTDSTSKMNGTKTFTLSDLTSDKTYEFEVEIELYDGKNLIDTLTFEDTFDIENGSKDGDPAIRSITVSAENSDTISASAFEAYDDDSFYGELEDNIELDRNNLLAIKVNADDIHAEICVESAKDNDSGKSGEWLYVLISDAEYDDGYTDLWIEVEDSDGYTTYYELTVWLD